MIIGEVYHSTKTPLDIPQELLRQLLTACTKEAPFRGPDNKLYLQVNRVASGFPLEVLFANFYMGMVERKVMENSNVKPRLYCRYIDDIFVEVRNLHHLEELRSAFETNSCLAFTYEICNENSLPFLDTLVSSEVDKYVTSVYTKKTNATLCMNGSGVSAPTVTN